MEAKLEEYCAKVPTPLSIAEFTERGRYSLPLKCPLMRIPKAWYDERGSKL